MALTATATQGFEFVRYTTDYEVLWVPGDPGDAIIKGDLMVAGIQSAGVTGLYDRSADSQAIHGLPGIAQKTVTITAATTAGFPKLSPRASDGYSWGDLDSDVIKTLVPIRPLVPAGVPILKATFANHWDDTVLVYNASTPSLELTTGMTADDYPNGGLIYVYEGTGAGQWNVVDDYDHTGHSDGDLCLVLVRKFNTALDSTSKIIVLGGEAVAHYGIGFGSRLDQDDENALDCSDGANNGQFVVYADARDIVTYLKNLTLPVIPAGLLAMA